MRLSSPTEQLVEDVASVYFGAIGAATKRGVEIDDAGERGDVSQVTLKGRLAAALHRLNADLPHDTIEEVVRILLRPPHPTLIQNNRWFHALVTDGVEIEYQESNNGETRGDRARLVDFDNPAANDLLVLRQLSVAGPSGKIIRPDLTVFLNGLPVAVIELKDPTDTQANLGVAIDQLDRYMQIAPDLFVSKNLVLVVSDGMLTRVGSITSGRSRFMPWRPIDDREGGGAPTLEALIRGLFDPPTLVDYLRTCVTFEEDERGEIAKKIAGYHQFRAVRKARTSVLAHLKPPSGTGDGRGGVIWHTQGSGKSLTMLMLAGGLIRESRMTNPRDSHDHRPQRSGRSALRHLHRRACAASAGPGPGREPGTSQGAARPRGGWGGVHDDPEVRRGARRDLGAIEHGRYGRRGTPQPVRLRRGRRALDARGAAERHLRRLHRHAAGARRQKHDPRIWRIRGRLRHPPSRRGRHHPAALLRSPHHQTEGGRGGRARRRGRG